MDLTCQKNSPEASDVGAAGADGESGEDDPFIKKPLVTLVVDDVPVHCNRRLLCKYSHYFEGMFRSGMQECNSDVIFLGSSSLTRSSSVTPGILKILVDFTFEESLPLTEDNVSDILHAANMYQFPKVEERCAEFLWKILDSSNCFQIMQLADTYVLYPLYNYARSWTFWNFSEVAQSECFLQATMNHVVELAEEDILNVASEMEVFTAIMTWAEHGEGSVRQMALNSVLEAVRFACMTPEEQEQVRKHPAVVESEDLRKFIERRMKTSKNERRQVPSVVHVLGSHCSLPSLAETHPNDPGPALPVELLRVNEKETDFQLVSHSKLTQPLPQGCSATVVGCCVYICGGEQQLGRNTWAMDLWQYHSLKQKWTIVGSLTQPRRHHTAVAWGDRLVLIGGCGRYRVILDSVESYDTTSGTWDKLPSFREPIYMAAATVCGDKLYVLKNHMEYLSSGAAQWTRLEADLPYHLGIRYCLPLEKKLCLSMPGQILVFDPETLKVIKTHELKEEECPQVTTAGGDIYALSYRNSYEHGSPSSRMVLTLKCLKEAADGCETLISMPKPDLKISSIFTMPTYPIFKELPKNKSRYRPRNPRGYNLPSSE